MKTKTVLPIVGLAGLAILFYVLLAGGRAPGTDNPAESKAVTQQVVSDTGETTPESDRATAQTRPAEQRYAELPEPDPQVSTEVLNFNQQIEIDFHSDYYDQLSRGNAVRLLEEEQRQDSSDVVEKIDRYYEDIIENQIEVADLILHCKRGKETFSSLEKKLAQPDGIVTERAFNSYYFYQGLLDSGICNDLGTNKDPFFVFLRSAREGNMLSQFLLNKHLYSALVRKLIDPWKYPLEYMSLRDESISYLQLLASKGVTRASIVLANMFSSSGTFTPPDRVLEYYYTVLAESQGVPETVYLRDPSRIYHYMTEEQKRIADKMTENL